MNVLPVTLQLPSGYSFQTGTSSGQDASIASTASASGASTTAAPTVTDTVDISNAALAGSFTAETADVYRLDDLFQGSAASGQAIAGYRVALDNGGDTTAHLLLNGIDVGSQTSFTPDQFSDLTYEAGADGSEQVIAHLGDSLTCRCVVGASAAVR